MAQIDVERSQEFRKCIECFLCQDVCHVVRDHEENKSAYAGPRFFIRSAELEMHPLDTNDRRELLQEEQGLGKCNITKCCTEVCPEHIKITDNAIIPLKERVVDAKYDPVAWLGRKIRKRSSGAPPRPPPRPRRRVRPPCCRRAVSTACPEPHAHDGPVLAASGRPWPPAPPVGVGAACRAETPTDGDPTGGGALPVPRFLTAAWVDGWNAALEGWSCPPRPRGRTGCRRRSVHRGPGGAGRPGR